MTLQLKDCDDVDSILFGSNPSDVGGNGVGFWPGNTGNNQNPEFYARGNGDNFGLSFRGKGNWFHAFHSTADAPTKIALYAKNSDTNKVTIAAPDTITASYEFTFPAAIGDTGDVLILSSGGHLVFASPASIGKSQYIPHSAVSLVSGNVNHIALTTSPTLAYAEGNVLSFFAESNNDAANPLTVTVDGNAGTVKMVSGGSLVAPPANAIVAGGYYQICADNAVGWILL